MHFFPKNMRKNVDKNLSINLNGKYSQKVLDHAKTYATDALKTSSKRVIQKVAEATSDLIRNEMAHKITKVSNNSQQNNSEKVTNDNAIEMSKERYISPEERKKCNDKLDSLDNNIIV